MKAFLILLFLTALAAVAEAQSPPRDLQNNVGLAGDLIAELRTGQFDVLESQYQDFRDQEHQIQPDGTPRSWIYFWTFSQATLGANSLEEAEAITAKIREWTQVKPNSIPALLALCDALLGECEKIRNQFIDRHLDSQDPQTVQQLQSRADEISAAMRAVPYEHLPTLVAEPEYSSVTVHLYLLTTVGYDRFQAIDQNLQQNSDPYYVPFYSNALVFLTNRRKHDASLPRPEIWLTDRLKPTLLDSDDTVKRKTETYAQVISFTSPEKVKFDPSLVDWPTLKAGLQHLTEDYSKSGWPSRYLLTAFQERDREAAREAFGIVGGSYSPEVISRETYEQITKWLEQG